MPRQSTCLRLPSSLPEGLGPSHQGTALESDLGAAPPLYLASSGMQIGPGLGFEFLELAGILFGLALLFGGLVIQALLLDGHARLVHALADGGIGGGLFAFLPGFGGFGVVVIGQIAIGQGLPVGRLARIAFGGGLPMRQALARIGVARAMSTNGSSSLGLMPAARRRAWTALSLSGSSLAYSM